jgi:AP endonuclease-1
MPPKRASSSKRKASDSDDEAPKTPKKAKVADAPINTQPTNKVLPVNIVFPGALQRPWYQKKTTSNPFPDRIPGTLRLATWNVCGLAASQKKGFKYYVEAEDPDILVLTETKVRFNSFHKAGRTKIIR